MKYGMIDLDCSTNRLSLDEYNTEKIMREENWMGYKRKESV